MYMFEAASALVAKHSGLIGQIYLFAYYLLT